MNSHYSFDKILISSNPWTRKISLEEEETKRFKDCAVQKVRSIKTIQ